MDEQKTRVLVVEDEVRIARFLQMELEHEGFEAEIEGNGTRASERIIQENFDIILLDVMLPGMDGIEICRRVRTVSNVPIIMLTARDAVEDRVEGLDIGADDYITKPFAVPELLARLRNALRRRDISTEDASDRLTVKNLIMFLSRYEVQVDGETVALTKREYDLLEYLLRNKRTVLTRDQILQEVWGFDYTGETNVVDVYIRYLRAKLDDRFHKKYIYTVRGVGYVVRD